MLDGDLHMFNVVLKHDEILFGSNRQNALALVKQVTHINNQINNINNAPAPDVRPRTEANELLDGKVDKSDTYNKNETNELLNEKANKTDLDDQQTKSETYAKVEVQNKTEVDGFLDEKANAGISYSKSETLARDKVYNKSEEGALLILIAEKTDLIDSNSKSEDDILLLLKANKTDVEECHTAGQIYEFLDEKAENAQFVDSYIKSEDEALLLLLNADKN
ncbi:MAG: hypothetical protein EZS28_031378 [Streblomastix strix]|uniref:Uncharacterized protein n=1 Tax=Streblomastix strix TaxID=222440 RepID=A0A5J4UQZ2_9EUKA|nr:MAG: hypothetical protein EZS28_031378 [Streblomastix strix]